MTVAMTAPVPAHSRVEPAEQAGCLMGRDVAPVREGVHRDARHARRECAAHDRAQVVDVRVHAAVGDQPGHVQHAAAGLGSRERGLQRGVLGQRAVGHGVADAHEILGDDPPRADVEMADLGVAHLPFGQAHRTPGCDQRRVRPALPERVEDRRASQPHGVAGAFGRTPEAVEDDQRDRCRHQSSSAARAIAAKACGSRLAPPTSAPSTSGSASSAPALSGLTEPP